MAFEWGPLSVTTCGSGVEGFENTDPLVTAQKIKRLGGNLQYIAMDEPEYYANIFKKMPVWPPAQIAANALKTVARIRTVFPNVQVGDIEPVPPPGAPHWLRDTQHSSMPGRRRQASPWPSFTAISTGTFFPIGSLTWNHSARCW